MQKRLITLAALSFGLAVGAANAMKHEKPDALATACKGKTAGTEVTINGKKVKCPQGGKPIQ